jgi:HEAT repeat protein
MKNIKTIIALLAVISVMGIGLMVYAQATIPKEKIPKNIPSSIREKIIRLYSSDPGVRGIAAHNLGVMGKDATPAVPYLISMLGDRYVYHPTTSIGIVVGREAGHAVLKILGRSGLKLLVSELDNKDKGSDVRLNVIYIFGAIEDSDTIEPLIRALKDKDHFVRSQSAKVLMGKQDKRLVNPLIDTMLNDSNMSARFFAAVALGKQKDPRAVEPLLTALKDQEDDVRRGAAGALGRIEDYRAIEPLIKFMKKRKGDDYVTNNRNKMAAREALKKITGKDCGFYYEGWSKWWEENKEEFLKKK